MTVCYFGDYDPEYNRNRVILRGLRKNGVEVIECRDVSVGTKKYECLYQKLRVLKNNYDLLIVGYSESRWMPILAALVPRRVVIWDAFYSKCEAYVFDKKIVKKRSPEAFYHYALEWLAGHLTEIILLDTAAHIDYFSKLFKIKKEKFIKVLVGCDETIFQPASTEAGDSDNRKQVFLVHFHGGFIPLQGVEYIVRAAKILEIHQEIKFQIIGTGQEYNKAIKLVGEEKIKNINFLGQLGYQKLKEVMLQADICLGIFGNTAKATRVIPNKVYEAIALAKPVITADTEAIRELFTDQENILLCKKADPRDLADKILILKTNNDLRNKIAQSGYQLFRHYATPKTVVEDLLVNLSSRSKELKYLND